jgi:hypothetical protein
MEYYFDLFLFVVKKLPLIILDFFSFLLRKVWKTLMKHTRLEKLGSALFVYGKLAWKLN